MQIVVVVVFRWRILIRKRHASPVALAWRNDGNSSHLRCARQADQKMTVAAGNVIKSDAVERPEQE
jgi:hypothetical protein